MGLSLSFSYDNPPIDASAIGFPSFAVLRYQLPDKLLTFECVPLWEMRSKTMMILLTPRGFISSIQLIYHRVLNP